MHTNAQETQTKPYSPHNHGFEQFQEIPIFSAHIWAWRHASALGSGTLKTPSLNIQGLLTVHYDKIIIQINLIYQNIIIFLSRYFIRL